MGKDLPANRALVLFDHPVSDAFLMEFVVARSLHEEVCIVAAVRLFFQLLKTDYALFGFERVRSKFSLKFLPVDSRKLLQVTVL